MIADKTIYSEFWCISEISALALLRCLIRVFQFDFGSLVMSHEEAKLLCELLDRMDAQGRVPGHEELLFTEGMMRAMADSSKRLRSENKDAGCEGYEWVGTPRAKQFHLVRRDLRLQCRPILRLD